MHCRYGMAALLSATLFLGLAPARADRTADVKKTLQQIYNHSDAALAAHDIEGYLDHVSLDVKFIGPKGQTGSYSEMRQGVEPIISIAKTASEKTVIEKCVLQGDGAVVTIRVKIMAVVVVPQSGKIGKFTGTQTAREYWDQSEGSWHVMQSRVLSEVVTLNGKRLVTLNPGKTAKKSR